MILTVTLNPALDLTYRVSALEPHATHRVSEVAERAGGKGLNVARVLYSLGEPVLASGMLGGDLGARIGRLLAADGVAGDFLAITGESRRTVAVADGVDATGFWEPGPVVTAAEWDVFRVHFRSLLDTADVVVLSGSLPKGLATDAYAGLIRLAREQGVISVLDTSGEALRLGIAAGPDVVKPNLDELRALEPGLELPEAAAALRELGAGTVVASAGPRGLYAFTSAGSWHAQPPEPVAGNPTGAGDAAVAALARGLRAGHSWPEILADAVATSAAAVAAPVAGAIDLPTVARLRPLVPVTPVPVTPVPVTPVDATPVVVNPVV